MEKKNIPAPFEQKTVEYTAADGQVIRLNIEMIKKYLISPPESAEKVTPQEFVFFLNVCKSRGLNPFIRDVYPVKYGNDPLAIITSIDFLRKRASAENDCEGWEKGIIVQTPEGKLRESHGIILEGEKLVGGWFRGYRKGWKNPFYLEVNLKSYIKRTKEGDITRFWKEENQPTMIAKIAEAQGLRTLWPGKFSKMYLAEEAGSPDYEITPIPYEMPPEALAENKQPKLLDFAISKGLKETEIPLFEEYCQIQARKNKKTIEELEELALRDFDNFYAYFLKFKAKKENSRQETLFSEKDLQGEGD